LNKDPIAQYNSFKNSVACTIDNSKLQESSNKNNNNEKCELSDPKLKAPWSDASEAEDTPSSGNHGCYSQSDFSDTDPADIEISYSRIVFDMSACSFIDNDGVKTIKTLHSDLFKLQIHLVLTRCSGTIRFYFV